MKMAFKTKLIQCAYLTVMGTTLSFCGADLAGDKKEEDTTTPVTGSTVAPDGGTSVSADMPSDSTGIFKTVSLNFSSISGTAASALALAADSTATTTTAASDPIDAGNGISITDARINIASIKLKANKEKSEGEKALRTELKAKKKEWKMAFKERKMAVKEKIKSLKIKFESDKGGMNDSDKSALEVKFKADESLIKEEMALIEKEKEDQEAEYENTHDKNVKWKGPYIYDLVSGTVEPALPSVDIVDGSYKRIEFKLKKNNSLAGTDLLLGNAVVIQGTVLINEVATSFIARFPNGMNFRLSGAGAFKIEDGAENPLNIAFQAVSWFTGVDIATGVVDATGVILIDDLNNKTLWNAMRKNIKSSTRFGKDKDGDGKLEDSESEGDGEENLEAVESEDEADEVDEADEDESV